VHRWVVVACAALVLAGVCVAWTVGRSGTRAAALSRVAAGWLGAWVLWGFAGGLAARWGGLAGDDAVLFAPLALLGGVWQYRTEARGDRERGLAIFVGGQLLWLLFVLARHGVLGG